MKVTISAPRKDIQTPFAPKTFAKTMARITIATNPLIKEPTMATTALSMAEK